MRRKAMKNNIMLLFYLWKLCCIVFCTIFFLNQILGWFFLDKIIG